MLCWPQRPFRVAKSRAQLSLDGSAGNASGRTVPKFSERMMLLAAHLSYIYNTFKRHPTAPHLYLMADLFVDGQRNGLHDVSPALPICS